MDIHDFACDICRNFSHTFGHTVSCNLKMNSMYYTFLSLAFHFHKPVLSQFKIMEYINIILIFIPALFEEKAGIM